jgi:hypothetical protein
VEPAPTLAAIRRVVVRALEAADRGDSDWRIHIEGSAFACENAAAATRAEARSTALLPETAARLRKLAAAYWAAASELRAVERGDHVRAAEGARRALEKLDVRD